MFRTPICGAAALLMAAAPAAAQADADLDSALAAWRKQVAESVRRVQRVAVRGTLRWDSNGGPIMPLTLNAWDGKLAYRVHPPYSSSHASGHAAVVAVSGVEAPFCAFHNDGQLVIGGNDISGIGAPHDFFSPNRALALERAFELTAPWVEGQSRILDTEERIRKGYNVRVETPAGGGWLFSYREFPDKPMSETGAIFEGWIRVPASGTGVPEAETLFAYKRTEQGGKQLVVSYHTRWEIKPGRSLPIPLKCAIYQVPGREWREGDVPYLAVTYDEVTDLSVEPAKLWTPADYGLTAPGSDTSWPAWVWLLLAAAGLFALAEAIRRWLRRRRAAAACK